MPADKMTTVAIPTTALAPYRYLSERTGIDVGKLVADTLIRCAYMYMVGANAGLEGASKAMHEGAKEPAKVKA